MKNVINETLFAKVKEALANNKYLHDYNKIENEQDWILVYYDDAYFNDERAILLHEICKKLGLLYIFRSHPTHIKICIAIDRYAEPVIEVKVITNTPPFYTPSN